MRGFLAVAILSMVMCSTASGQEAPEIRVATGETAVIFLGPEGKILQIVRLGGQVSSVTPAAPRKPKTPATKPPAATEPSPSDGQAIVPAGPGCLCGPECPCRRGPAGYHTLTAANELREIAGRMRAIATRYATQ